MGNRYKAFSCCNPDSDVQIVIILDCVGLPIFVKMKLAFNVSGSRYNSIANYGYSSTI